MKKRLYSIFLLFLFTTVSEAQDYTYKLVEAFPNQMPFLAPLEVVFLPDGSDRLVVGEHRGKFYIHSNDVHSTERKLYLDLSGVVSRDTEGFDTGLQGYAFDPDYADNGYVYINFTSSREDTLVSYISRFQASGNLRDTVELSTERVLIKNIKVASEHNGGTMVFGPDSLLYISLGDGGGWSDPANNAQTDSTMFGKILRIDVRDTTESQYYGIPVDNPYILDTTNKRKEIYAKGLRNVWRFSFDKLTGELWSGDVGQDHWEEINIIENGKNYGWKVLEGGECYSPRENCDSTGMTMPVYVYQHDTVNFNNCVTGGIVYRGIKIPALYGAYIYADFISGRIWSLRKQFDSIAMTYIYVNELLFDRPNLETGNGNIVTIAVDAKDELYFMAYNYGKMYRIEATKISVSGKRTNGVQLSIHPNPATDELMVHLHGVSTSQAMLRIIDALGNVKIVKEIPPTGSILLNIKSLPSGSYLLKVDAGRTSYSRKVVIY